VGPEQRYEILKLDARELDARELEVVARIEAGSVRIANTTVLDRP